MINILDTWLDLSMMTARKLSPHSVFLTKKNLILLSTGNAIWGDNIVDAVYVIQSLQILI